MRRLLKHMASCTLFGLYLLFLFVVTFYVPTRWDYTVQAEFRELPPDDKGLEQWLLEQPGVDGGSVHRDGKRVVATWGNNRVYVWHPSTLNLRDEFEEFGYKEVVSYDEHKNCRDRGD
jgi:hypothetical protein